MNNEQFRQLVNKTKALSLQAIHNAGSGHPGGCLSVAEILCHLYFRELRNHPEAEPGNYDPSSPQRDICILSKGHAAPMLYSVLSQLKNPPITEAEVLRLRKLGSKAQGHPSLSWLPAVEASTGSLGQGVSVAVGFAYMLKGSGRRVYCVLGDGDMAEGVSVEAMRISEGLGLSNLFFVLDCNGKQSDRHSVDYARGHLGFSMTQVNYFELGYMGTGHASLYGDADLARNLLPQLAVVKTIKGAGVSFMMLDRDGYHGSIVLSDKELEIAVRELS